MFRRSESVVAVNVGPTFDVLLTRRPVTFRR
jgi:hypothetical protein